MAFRTFLSTLGAKAPEVETVLDRSDYRPGEQVQARVTLRGGGADVEIEALRLEVVSRFENRESEETGWRNPGTVTTWTVAEDFRLEAEKEHVFDVTLELPWETPLTHIMDGRRLKGGRVAVRTELAVDKAVDRGDFDEITVHALPPQDTVLRAFEDIGFRIREAEVKKGRPVSSVASAVDFWQEIEMDFPAEAGFTEQLEFVFNARRDEMDLLFGNAGRLADIAYAGLDAARLRERIDAYWRELFLSRR